MSTIAKLEEKVKELLKEIETLKRREKAEEFEYPFEDNETCYCIDLDGELLQERWITKGNYVKDYYDAWTDDLYVLNSNIINNLVVFGYFLDEDDAETAVEMFDEEIRKFFIEVEK